MAGVAMSTFDFKAIQMTALQPQNNDTEILFCVNGRARLAFQGNWSLELKKGEILLISDVLQLETVSFTEQPVQGVLVCVDVPAARKDLSQLCGMLCGLELDVERAQSLLRERGGIIKIRENAWTEAAFSALKQLPEGERAAYGALKATELLYLLCRESPLLLGEPIACYFDRHQQQVVRKMHDYMMTHLSERLTIEGLARRFHISATLLKGCFRQLYGQPVHQYLLEQRLRRAAEVLVSTEQPILQVAGAVGYESVSQFGAAFKRRYSITPARYRKAAWAKNV